MIKYIKNLLLRIWPWYRNRALYVIADAKDNSITFSKGLFNLLDVMKLDVAKVYVFRICNAATEDLRWAGPLYAFAINPPLEQPSQLGDIQYNSKHKTIGFECLCPSVNRIFYDYGLKEDTAAKLSVLEGKADNGQMYYIILPPYEKHSK